MKSRPCSAPPDTHLNPGEGPVPETPSETPSTRLRTLPLPPKLFRTSPRPPDVLQYGTWTRRTREISTGKRKGEGMGDRVLKGTTRTEKESVDLLPSPDRHRRTKRTAGVSRVGKTSPEKGWTVGVLSRVGTGEEPGPRGEGRVRSSPPFGAKRERVPVTVRRPHRRRTGRSVDDTTSDESSPSRRV